MYGGKYSQTKYSLNQGVSLPVTVACNGAVMCDFTPTMRLILTANTAETTGSALDVVRGLPLSAVCEGIMGAAYNLTLLVNAGFATEENARATSYLSKKIPANAAENDSVAGSAYLTKKIPLLLDSKESLGHIAHLGKDIPLSLAARAVTGAAYSPDMLVKESMFLNVALEPGSTIYIDTENMTVYVNRENAIHLHEGDWIQVSPKLVHLQVDCDDQISGSAVYTERFV